jgi:hypothetical protein
MEKRTQQTIFRGALNYCVQEKESRGDDAD